MRRLLSSLAVLTLAAPAATAAQELADYDYENLWFSGVGIDFGHMWANKVEAAPVFTLRLDLGYLGPGVRVQPGVSFWTSSLKDSEIVRLVEQLNELPGGGAFQPEDFGEIDWSDVSFFVDVQAVWRTPLPLTGYIGASAALHALNGRGPAIQDTFVEDLLDTFTPGLGVTLGVEVEPLPRLRFYGEGRYTFLSDINYGGVHAGAAFLLPPPTNR